MSTTATFKTNGTNGVGNVIYRKESEAQPCVDDYKLVVMRNGKKQPMEAEKCGIQVFAQERDNDLDEVEEGCSEDEDAEWKEGVTSTNHHIPCIFPSIFVALLLFLVVNGPRDWNEVGSFFKLFKLLIITIIYASDLEPIGSSSQRRSAGHSICHF